MGGRQLGAVKGRGEALWRRSGRTVEVAKKARQ